MNINLDGYNFMHRDSKTNARCVGIYIKNSNEYEMIKQINLDLNDPQNLRVKLEIMKNPYIVEALYRHPV